MQSYALPADLARNNQEPRFRNLLIFQTSAGKLGEPILNSDCVFAVNLKFLLQIRKAFRLFFWSASLQKNSWAHMTEISSLALTTRIFFEALPNEILAKGNRLFLHVHLKLCELGNVIFAC